MMRLLNLLINRKTSFAILLSLYLDHEMIKGVHFRFFRNRLLSEVYMDRFNWDESPKNMDAPLPWVIEDNSSDSEDGMGVLVVSLRRTVLVLPMRCTSVQSVYRI